MPSDEFMPGNLPWAVHLNKKGGPTAALCRND
jgi:hypothetical protein